MAENNINYGYQQSGGTAHIGNQAIGHGATANSGPPAQLVGLLDELSRLVEENRERLPAEAEVSARILREELAAEQPNRSLVSRMISSLSDLVKPVAPLATTVAEIAKAVGELSS
ncbi:hypothetical protein D5S17_16105 [Pseudonocardiaceae bacterium YIM PH 21723]|nr:hypothetical protein D5S17_16105 [Pseudonocardiaceae bacterium YIM PH 21723]